MTTTVLDLELSLVIPSPTNPRRSYDQAALKELAASIREVGVTQPILVRPMAGDGMPAQYELVSGERRWRAAKIAGLDHIPCFVRELSDGEALDIQMVENLQRADLHPMDEAAGYKQLIDASADRGTRLTQEELAAKVGKPLSYVAQRVKLLDLGETPAKVFADGHINLGHALILARLQPEDQDQGLRAIFDPYNQYRKQKDTLELIKGSIEQHKNAYGARREAAEPVTVLKNWVKQNVELDLEKAPWHLADDDLLPEAGACVTCPKRSGANPALFFELTTGDQKCTDPSCFEAKTRAFVQVTLKAAEVNGKPLVKLSNHRSEKKLDGTEKTIKDGQWLQAKQKSCGDTQRGLMVDGPDTGKLLWVCINQKCKTHKHRVEQAPSAAPVQKPKNEAERKAARDAEERKEAQSAAERQAIYAAVQDAAVAKKSREELLIEFAVVRVNDEIYVDLADLCKMSGVEVEKGGRTDYGGYAVKLTAAMRTWTGEKWARLIFNMTYAELVDLDQWQADKNYKKLVEMAKEYAIDTKALLAKLKLDKPALYAEPKAPEPVKPKKGAKKSAGAKPAPVVDRKRAAAGDKNDHEDLPEFNDVGIANDVDDDYEDGAEVGE